MDFILNIPVYLYQGLLGIWWIIERLPWPDWKQYFGSVVLFVVLYYPRNYMERRFLRKLARRQKASGVPSPSDHQSAASIITESLHL